MSDPSRAYMLPQLCVTIQNQPHPLIYLINFENPTAYYSVILSFQIYLNITPKNFITIESRQRATLIYSVLDLRCAVS